MTVADRHRRARDSFDRRIWGEAFAELSAAHREGELEVEDLVRAVDAFARHVQADQGIEIGRTRELLASPGLD